MFIRQSANATRISSSLDGCLDVIASHLPITARHLATIASYLASPANHPSVIARHLAVTASRLAIAARHPSVIATHLAAIARHLIVNATQRAVIARHTRTQASHHAMLARCLSNTMHHPIYFLVTTRRVATRKYKRRQRLCIPHHQHRAEHHRPHPATRPRHECGMELQSHLSFPR